MIMNNTKVFKDLYKSYIENYQKNEFVFFTYIAYKTHFNSRENSRFLLFAISNNTHKILFLNDSNKKPNVYDLSTALMGLYAKNHNIALIMPKSSPFFNLVLTKLLQECRIPYIHYPNNEPFEVPTTFSLAFTRMVSLLFEMNPNLTRTQFNDFFEAFRNIWDLYISECSCLLAKVNLIERSPFFNLCNQFFQRNAEEMVQYETIDNIKCYNYALVEVKIWDQKRYPYSYLILLNLKSLAFKKIIFQRGYMNDSIIYDFINDIKLDHGSKTILMLPNEYWNNEFISICTRRNIKARLLKSNPMASGEEKMNYVATRILQNYLKSYISKISNLKKMDTGKTSEALIRHWNLHVYKITQIQSLLCSYNWDNENPNLDFHEEFINNDESTK